MGRETLFVVTVLCRNDYIYLQNLIPQLLEVADKVIVLDDFSKDGTKEYLESLGPKLEFYQREFDNCANQFDYALQKAPKDNTWVLDLTAIELPTIDFFKNIRRLLGVFDEKMVDRAWLTVFHLRTERTICKEIGGELRLFRNDACNNCRFMDAPHERLDGKFEGNCVPQVGETFAFVRFRQADPKKIQEWLTDYVEKGIYSLRDLKRRLNYHATELAMFINYRANKALRDHLGWESA